jgi:type IV pilus assembly protein PilA
MNEKNKRLGFTLLEILLVVAAIAILAAIVIVAINPTKQLAQTKNAQRRSDVNSIINGIYQYSIDRAGSLPPSISTTPTLICKTGTATATCSSLNLTDLQVVTVNETYLTAIPVDPTNTATASTGYMVSRSTNGRVTVSAPNAEQGETISVTK